VNLKEHDFALSEDGVPQKDLRVRKTTEEEAVSVVLLLDGSGSMYGSTGAVVTAAGDFITLLSPKDRAAIVFFGDRVESVCPFTNNREQMKKAISRLGASGGTALYDSIYRASVLLGDVKGRKAIILLTDGVDENGPGTAPGSSHTITEALDLAKQKDCIIYSIGLGHGVDKNVLTQLAGATGGSAYFQPSGSELGDAYRKIALELRCQYILTYFSSNTKKDGSFRHVRITTPALRSTVHSKSGYTAPQY
jgi:VWFA-related protein